MIELAGWLGFLVGSGIAVAVVSAVISLVAFKREEPGQRAMQTVALAVAICGTIGAFMWDNFTDGGRFAWWAYFYYMLPAIVVWMVLKTIFERKWRDDERQAGDSDVFE